MTATFFAPAPDRPRLAVRQFSGTTSAAGVVFLHGLASDMRGSKAEFLAERLQAQGHAFTRFDYRGHGESEGALAQSVISDWLADAEAVLLQCTQGPQVLVGSSLGGWLALLLAVRYPERVAGVVGLAAAPDFTEDLFPPAEGEAPDADLELMLDGAEAPIVLSRHLQVDGRRHLLLRDPIAYSGPVRLLHGSGDMDVPWQTALNISNALTSDDVRFHLIKRGDHRLSRPQDLALLHTVLCEMI